MVKLSLPLMISGLVLLGLSLSLPDLGGLSPFAVETASVLNPSQVSAPDISNPANAFSQDSLYADFGMSPGQTKTGDYSGFAFSLPAGATITKVEAGIEHYETGLTACILFLSFRAESGSGSFVGGLGHQTSSTFFWVDITTMRVWLDSSAVTATHLKYSVRADTNGCTQSPTSRLGWLPLRVTYQTADNQSPVAKFTFTPSSAKINETVSFDGGLSSDSDGAISQYKWNFGDSTPEIISASDPKISHAFTKTGNFTTLLTVADNQGATSSSSAMIMITSLEQPPPPPPPTVSFTWSAVNLTVTFTSTVTGGTPPYAYLWEFGTSATSADPNPVGTYGAAGSYNVTLTVTDTADLNGAALSIVTVTSGQTNTGISSPLTDQNTSISNPPPPPPSTPAIDFLTGIRILLGTVGAGLLLLGLLMRRRG